MNETGYTEAEALAALRDAIHANGLAWDGWTGRLDRATSHGGITRYNTRVIGLSRLHVLSGTRAQVDDTIMHEVAHALAGHSAGHGPEWQAVARGLGARPDRMMDVESSVAMSVLKRKMSPWVGVCPNGCRWPRQRAPKRGALYSCARCGGGSAFDGSLVIAWYRRGEVPAPAPVAAKTVAPVEPEWVRVGRERGRAIIAANLAARQH